MARPGSEASSSRPYTRLTSSLPACNIITLVVALFLGTLSLWSAPDIATAQEDTASEIDRLIEALKDEDADVRRSAAEALGQFGALGRIGEKAEAAVPALIETLKDEEGDVRWRAADALGWMGKKAEPAVPALIEALKDEDEGVRRRAAEALGQIAITLRDARKASSLGVLIQARDALEGHNDPRVNEFAPPVRRAVEYFEQLHLATWNWLPDWMAKHKGLSATIAIVPLWLTACLLIFWWQPSALLTINDAIRNLDFTLPDWAGGVTIPTRHLLFVGFLNFHPRVLDAWIARYVGQARENFERKRTVSDRSVHIPIPVELDRQTVAELRGPDLRRAFSAGNRFLLIWGEGGAGKTSIACQIAQWGMAEEPEQRAAPHLMLPVLIERELDFDVAEGKNAFIEAIRGDLEHLIDASVQEHLFQALLEQRRILVIVDHLSEMSAATQQRVRSDVPDFPVSALIVTSRVEEKLGDAPKSTLKPMRVTGDYLFEFMGAYLRARDARELFPDQKFGEAGGRIAELVGQRDVTVLLVKLFLDQMIRMEERGREGGDALPQNIPDLMLRYVDDINESIPDDERLDPREVYKDSQAVAWACLKETFRPAAADIDKNVLPALTAIKAENATDRLTYLDKRLHLIETIEPGYDKVRYLLDPLAEYLAGLHLVGTYRDDEEKWRQFLVRADGMKGGLDAIKGYLLAVHDCCLAKQKDEAIPQFVIDECAKRAGFDPETMEQARLQQRVAHYIKQLRASDPDDRKIAAEALGKIGKKAEAAVPALIEALKDEDEDVRLSVSEALGEIGEEAEAAVPALIEALKDEDFGIRTSVALALREIGEKAEAAVPALIEALEDQDAFVRASAADALRKIGEKAEAAVPALIEVLKHETAAEIRDSAAVALGEIGEKAEAAVPALIEALKDQDVNVQRSAADALRLIKGQEGGLGSPEGSP